MSKGTNYRKSYEKITGVKLPKSFEVHHIDGDRTNNHILNLVALPRKLHKEYHAKLSYTKNFEITSSLWSLDVDMRRGNGYIPYIMDLTMDMFKVYNRATLWVAYRDYLLGNLPNIFNLSYEDE
jgi:hypothetical protein